MALVVPDLTITCQQRRWACVLDPALVLSPYGLPLSRLGEVLDVWVGRELWHILDNTHFYAQHPALLVDSTTRTTDTAPAARAALQALLAWERWRGAHQQAGLKLFWVGDDPTGSLLPTGSDTSLIWRYETLACALDQQASGTAPLDPVFTPAFRDVAALAVALRSAFILARPGLVEPMPPLCTALTHWGVPCVLLAEQDALVRVERDYLQHVLVQAGLAPLCWAGGQLAVLHLWVPETSTLWPEPREARFDGLEELTAPTEAPGQPLWHAAQGFWYLL